MKRLFRFISLISLICFFLMILLGIIEEYSSGLIGGAFRKMDQGGFPFEMRIGITILFLLVFVLFWLFSE